MQANYPQYIQYGNPVGALLPTPNANPGYNFQSASIAPVQPVMAPVNPPGLTETAAAYGMTPDQYQIYVAQYQQYLMQYYPQYFNMYGAQQQNALAQSRPQQESYIDPTNPKAAMRTLYIGNLDPKVNEGLLMSICSELGQIVCVKLIQEKTKTKPGYAFVEFARREDAEKAFVELNGTKIFEREVILNWSVSQTALDAGKAVRVWCGGLSPDMGDERVLQLFEPFGNVLDAHVMRDPQTGKSKLYAFITFSDRKSAEKACSSLNGTKMGARTLNVNLNIKQQNSDHHNAMSYDSVLSATPQTNTTVWIGGVGPEVEDRMLHEHLIKYGVVENIRMYREKSCAFARFKTHESAALCITSFAGTKVAQSIVKCSWGKNDQ